ncbi:MAG: hypothetical protein GKC04_08410 [Methanomicrobiales archaeon]|nr:hypothetical protein [Methanomicrobiales archaeon]
MTRDQVLDELMAMALDLGASVAGYLPAELLRTCPSAMATGKQSENDFSGTIIILGLFHDPARPEMDWWEEGRSTPGDRMLGGIARTLAEWLVEYQDIAAYVIPYQIEDGGIFLKDAAVLAGIGCMGRNNLVLVPGYGPRVRFRALWADLPTDAPGAVAPPSPCRDCNQPCENQCPYHAFEGGRYSRERCLQRMDADRAASGEKKRPVEHCRICELCCPEGRRVSRTS